jgi:hypothetical protein
MSTYGGAPPPDPDDDPFRKPDPAAGAGGSPPPGQGQPPYGQPSYGQPPYGQPPYGQPPYGSPYGQQPPLTAPPPNYLVMAILAVLCCTIPGIVSVVYAAQVNGKFHSGDIAGAQAASGKARSWAIASFVLGIVGLAVYTAFLFATATA